MRMHVWTDRGWHGARTLQAPGCRAVAWPDVQGGFGARRLPERRRPVRCLPVRGCDTPRDAAGTLCALRPRAGPVAAPATFAQPMPLPTGRKDMRDRQTSWLLAGALVTALAGCTPERAAPVAEPPVTAGDDMPTPASTQAAAMAAAGPSTQAAASSEERRVGQECVSTFSSRWARYH